MRNLIFSILLFSFSISVFAKDGSSGCGPGWYVAKDRSILSSALRFTTNAILIPTVTLGMTFGISNCTKHSIVKLEKERVKFATENYFEIASNVASGEGDFLAAYGELMGCHGNMLDRFSNRMKKNFQKVFPSTDINPENVVKQTYIIMLQDEELTKACFQV